MADSFSMALLLVYIGIFNYFPIAYSFIGSFLNGSQLKVFSGLKALTIMHGCWANRFLEVDVQYTGICAGRLFFYVALGLIFATLIYMSPRFQGFSEQPIFACNHLGSGGIPAVEICVL